MDDMLITYRETRGILRNCKAPVVEKKSEIEKLIGLKRKANKNFEEEEKELATVSAQLSLLNRMLSDVQLAIDWLTLGHNPGPRRGIHRLSMDQLTIPVDPLRMQSYAQPAACGSPTTLTDSERFLIDDALSTLSKREKECYVLKHGMCFSLKQIAEELSISKSTVQEYIANAEKKVKDSTENSLFLICS